MVLIAAAAGSAGAKPTAVTAPPGALVKAWGLSPVYTRYLSVGGLPVLGSAKVSGFAVAEAAYLVRKMIGHRPDILRALVAGRVRVVAMAATEVTTDVPEHSDLRPRAYWNRRARGLGATRVRPAVSSGEENLLDLPGDPYAKENIFIHEFAHTIHELGLSAVDPTFDGRLRAAYDSARAKGLWKGTYAMENPSEYWAEAVQSWFDCNRANDHDHGPIATREKLKAYDRKVATLCAEVFGDGRWRYRKPSKRPAAERAHLRGFDVAKGGRFAWPREAPTLEQQGQPLRWSAGRALPSASPRGEGAKTTILFVNRRKRPVTVEWLDFDGRRKTYGELRPAASKLQRTFAGHVWVVSERGVVLGHVVATGRPGRVVIR